MRRRRNPTQSHVEAAGKTVAIGAAIGGGLGGLAAAASGYAPNFASGIIGGAGAGASIVGLWNLVVALAPKNREEKLVTAAIGIGGGIACGVVGAFLPPFTSPSSNALTGGAATTADVTTNPMTSETTPAATTPATTAPTTTTGS